jgi:hypothetical protein
MSPLEIMVDHPIKAIVILAILLIVVYIQGRL